MNSQDEIKNFIVNGHKIYLKHLSLDCVIFGYHEHLLKVLLLKNKGGCWSVAGGFIKHDEPLQDAAARILKERTGLDKLFLQQYQTFGEPGRSIRTDEQIKNLSAIANAPIGKNHWLLERTLSLGYYAVTEYSKVNPQQDYFSEACEWRDIDSLPPMVFDHELIITEALKALRMQIYHQPIGFNLLPEKFTLPEIHDLYETILGKKLDRRNFPKKLLALGLIKKLNEQKKIGAHRSPYLYKFDKRRYDRALKEGIVLAF
jgi:ADP-ribose pyrophosphatase YjhB (NUDIX family)